MEEVIRQLPFVFEEDRGRYIRNFAVPSHGELSSLSDENSGGAATCIAPLIDESALTPCG